VLSAGQVRGDHEPSPIYSIDAFFAKAIETAVSVPPAFEWSDGAAYVLDQRRLPDAVEVVRCARHTELNAAIRTLAIRGAPLLGVAAAYAIALGAQEIDSVDEAAFLRELDYVVAGVVATRPTAANLPWAAGLMRRTVGELRGRGVAVIRAGLLERAHAIARDNAERHRRLSDVGAALFAPGDRVLHHCNTGALATGDYGSALGVLREAHRRHGITVWVGETRPLLQGARLTTWELAQWGVPYTLITDSMVAYFMRRGEIDKAIVGADRIAANGDVANKIGTYGIAALAHLHDVPFYVAAPTSTIDFATPDGDRIPIEQRTAAEVRGFGGVRWAPATAPVANPAFDVTPSHLVTAIITEHGIAAAPFATTLPRVAPPLAAGVAP